MSRKTVDQTGSEVQPTGPVSPVAADRSVMLAQFVTLLTQVPDAPESDGTEIMTRLLGADNWEDLKMTGTLPHGKDAVGRQLKVWGVVKRPGDLDAELPWYLVIESEDMATHKPFRWSTGAPGLVIPLAKLHVWGKYPAVVRVTEGRQNDAGKAAPLNLDILVVKP